MEKFGVSNFLVTFALAITKHAFAEIAQLVERNLAKVEVAGPSPVFRSRGGQKETPIESKNHCISAIYNDFSFTPPTPVEAKGSKYFTP